MKKKLFLQLFADAGSEPGGTDPKGGESEGKDQEGSDSRDGEPEKKYTDADIDEIINKRFARWQKEQQKKEDEAAKLAAMNEKEKAKYEKEQLEKELNEYKRKDSIAKMTKTARGILAESNISVSDDLLSMFVSTDAEQTKAAVEAFADSFSKAVENAVKERLKGEPPRRGAGGVTKMTKEEIMSIKDPELRQQKMLENRELFNF